MNKNVSINRKLYALVALACIMLFAFLLSAEIKAADKEAYTLTYEKRGTYKGYVIKCNISTQEKTEIVIPEVYGGFSVMGIGEYAFDSDVCSQITDITLPKTITYIDGNPFEGCKDVVFHLWCGTPDYIIDNIEGNRFTYDFYHDEEPQITVPTCTEGGYTTYSCDGCGIHYTDNYTEPLGHSYSPIIIKATCTSGGYTNYKCIRCTDSYRADYTSSLGHSFLHTVVEPTCYEDGYKLSKCQRYGCGYSSVDNIPSVGHSFENWIIDIHPVIGVEGKRHRKCIFCDEIEEEIIPALTDLAASGTCGSDMFWEYNPGENTLYITGSGAMKNFSSSTLAPWKEKSYGIKNVIIENGITNIGNYAFYGCTEVKSVIIPNTVERVGYYAFSDCTSLEEITVGKSVSLFESNAFADCPSLKKVHIDSFEHWCEISFGNYKANPICTAHSFYINGRHVKTAYIENGITNINANAFRSCDLTMLVLPTTIISIGSNAFAGTSGLIFNCYENSYAHEYVKENKRLYELITPSATGECGKGVVWNYFSIDGVLVISGNGKMNNYTDAKPTPWKEFASDIEFVVINNGVKSVGNRAFLSCDSLYCVVITDTVEKIGANAFSGCSAMSEVFLGKGLVTVGSNAFLNCSSLEKVHISDFDSWCSISFANYSSNPIAIAKSFYVNGTHVTDVVLSSEVLTIKPYTFRCSDIESIKIPITVEEIGNSAFYACSAKFLCYENSYSLEYAVANNRKHVILFPDDGGSCGTTLEWSYYEDSGLLAIAGSGSMKDYTDSQLPPWITYKEKIKKVFISKGVTRIGSRAFISFSNTSSFIISDTVESIGGLAFSGCTSLTEVKLGNNLTGVGPNAFKNCTSLEKVHISDFDSWCSISFASVNSNPITFASSFYIDGVHITEAVLSDKVKSIGAYAFRSSDLEKIIVPSSVTSIGSSAFSACPNLVLYVTQDTFAETYAMDRSVKYLVYGTCGNETIWTYDVKTCRLTIDGEGEMSNFTSSKPAPWLSYRDLIKSVTIGDGITSIGNQAFILCTSVKTATIPDSVKKIGSFAFNKCYSLTEVTFGKGIETIGTNAFSSCTSLEKVHISDFDSWCAISFANASANPITLGGNFCVNGEIVYEAVISDNVKSIGDYAFRSSTLATVVVPSTVISIGTEAFAHSSELVLYISAGSVAETYAKDNKISYLIWGNCGYNIVWEYNTRKAELRIKGRGEMTHYSSSYLSPWSDYRDDIETLVIEDGITSIGNQAFILCTSVKTVTVPDSVKKIGSFAFNKCYSLTEVTFGKGIESVGTNAFSSCTSLEKVHIFDFDTWCGISFAGRYANPISSAGAFYIDGIHVTSADISPNVTSIGAYAFGLSDIQSIVLPSSVTAIGNQAFAYCKNLVINVDVGSYGENYALENELRFVVTGECGTAVQFSFDSTSGNLTVFGNGCMSDYKSSVKAPWISYADRITSVVVEKGVISIGNRAFISLSNIKSATVSDTVETIGTYAFTGCTSLTDIAFGSGVKSVANYAFSNCPSLKKVHITDFDSWCGISFGNVQANPISTAKSFYIDGKHMTRANIGEEVSSIGAYAFRSSDLEKITVGSSVMSIGDGAFAYCSDLVLYVTIGSFAETYAKNNKVKYIVETPFTLMGTALVLDGAIGVKLYMKMDESVMPFVEFKTTVFDNDKETVIYERINALGNGIEYDDVKQMYYLVSYVAPKDVDNIEIRNFARYSGNMVELGTVTVSEYIDNAKKLAEGDPDSEFADAYNLLCAIEDYAKYADVYFNRKGDDGYLATNVASISKISEPVKSGSTSGINFHGTSLILDSVTTVRHYFYLTEGFNIRNYTFIIDGVEYAPQLLGEGCYYIDIEDIPAHELGKITVTEVKYKYSSRTLSVSYSPLNYVKQTYKSNDRRLCNLSRALYNYYSYAKSYASSH